MVAPLVLVHVGKEKADEVWVARVLAAESLQNLDFLLILGSVLTVERFDGEVPGSGSLSCGYFQF